MVHMPDPHNPHNLKFELRSTGVTGPTSGNIICPTVLQLKCNDVCQTDRQTDS